MTALLHLTPAELLVLQRGSQAPVRHMLRFTFADLLLRDVLRIEYREFQPTPHDPTVAYAYVRPGEAHACFRPRPHEAPLLEIIPGNRQMMLMRHYVGVLLEHLPPSKLRQLAAVGFEQAGFVQRNGWHRFWNTFGWTHMGTAHRAVVQRETEALIEQVNKRLLGLGELRNRLYGTALLLGDALLPSMQEFDRELVRHLLRRKQQASFGTDWSSGFGGCSGTSESSGAPDFGGGHSGGGGASGDFGDGDSSSGCSGSGCSGCGGCGGD